MATSFNTEVVHFGATDVEAVQWGGVLPIDALLGTFSGPVATGCWTTSIFVGLIQQGA